MNQNKLKFIKISQDRQKSFLEGQSEKAGALNYELQNIVSELIADNPKNGVQVFKELCEPTEDDYTRMVAASFLSKYEKDFAKMVLEEISAKENFASLEAQLLLININ